MRLTGSNRPDGPAFCDLEAIDAGGADWLERLRRDALRRLAEAWARGWWLATTNILASNEGTR